MFLGRLMSYLLLSVGIRIDFIVVVDIYFFYNLLILLSSSSSSAAAIVTTVTITVSLFFSPSRPENLDRDRGELKQLSSARNTRKSVVQAMGDEIREARDV